MWITAVYEPVTVFGLRPSNTTSSGGKSLLLPTPYAIKMGLLDRMIRIGGEAYGRAWFPTVRDLHIYAALPTAVAVTRSFQKVLRPGKGSEWTETIAQREYCVHTGVLRLAFETADEAFVPQLPSILSAVNYFGRKGGFFQLIEFQTDTPDLAQFVDLCAAAEAGQLRLRGFLQRMDDMLPDATFDAVSTYNPKGDGARSSYNVILPYQLAHNGFNHTVYALKR